MIAADMMLTQLKIFPKTKSCLQLDPKRLKALSCPQLQKGAVKLRQNPRGNRWVHLERQVLGWFYTETGIIFFESFICIEWTGVY